ncbi:MAG: phosphatase PAP2 family protein [Anaerolineales bacterium]|nr:phosphatase PAP2 family protein [Anaerolineales bacterium]NUQ86048.1 phosphatase PAP2 family protein [Anaerolineales bacterium]
MSLRSFILELDARLSGRMRVAEKPGALRAFAVFFAHSGDSWFWAIALIALWAGGDSSWKKWAVVQFAGIGVLAALVMGIKFLVRRRRPQGEWGGIYRNTDPHSFPSGHAARSFLIAVVATGLGPGGAAIVLWVWAPLVAVARVAMGVHYVSDIVAGALLGIAFALIGLQVYEPVLTWASGIIHIPLW